MLQYLQTMFFLDHLILSENMPIPLPQTLACKAVVHDKNTN